MPSSRAARLISEVGRFVENHLADAVAQIQQFVDRGSAAEARAAAFEAARAFVECQPRATRPGSRPLSTSTSSG